MAHAVMDHPRVFVATLVAVAPRNLMNETAAALEALRARAALRTILIVPGDDPAPPVVSDDDATTIEGLLPRYMNNAVALLRVSSLPSVAWWRGADGGVLGGLASLVDRLVLDSPDASADWAAATDLHDHAAISDLRWTRLTRWRILMAQFFDAPDVRADARSLAALDIVAADRDLARLFAAWITSRLPHGGEIAISISDSPAGHPMHSISLLGPRHRLRLTLLPSGTCVESTIERTAAAETSRVVPLGDQSIVALLQEELRVRSRDLAYEQAVRSMRLR